MNYEENPQNEKKSNTGLIVTIACALLIVAAAAWFAISRYNSNPSMDNTVSEIKSEINSVYSDIESSVSEITSDIKSEYDDMTSSYNDTVSDNSSVSSSSTTSTAPTNEEVSSIPYATSFIKPVEGKIIKKFSADELQYSKTFGDMRLHEGIDIACKNGTEVKACSDGKVLTVEKNGPYGNTVTIEHTNGITAKYSSLDEISVKEGDKIKSGKIIGKVTTIPAECDDQPHLHFEVLKDGSLISPFEALNIK